MPKTKASSGKAHSSQAAYKAKMEAAGYRLKQFYLSPEALAALDTLTNRTGKSAQTLVADALLALVKPGSNASMETIQPTRSVGNGTDIEGRYPTYPQELTSLHDRMASLERAMGSIIERLGCIKSDEPKQATTQNLVRVSTSYADQKQHNETVELVLRLAGELWLENDSLSLNDILTVLKSKGITTYSVSQALGKRINKAGGKEAVKEFAAEKKSKQGSLLDSM